MRWIGAIAGRVLQFWGVWFALLSAFCCCGTGVSDGYGAWRLIRIMLFLSTAALLTTEWSRTNRVIEALTSQMKEAGLQVPRRGGRWAAWFVGSFVPFSLGAWSVWFALLSPAVHRVGSESLLVAIGVIGFLAMAWSLATLLTVLLAISGGTHFRYRWAARKLPPESRPKLKPVLPWSVAAWSSCALFVALGFPSPEIIVGMAQIAILLATPTTHSTTSYGSPALTGGTTEVLVTLVPGRTVADAEAIGASEGTARAVFPTAVITQVDWPHSRRAESTPGRRRGSPCRPPMRQRGADCRAFSQRPCA